MRQAVVISSALIALAFHGGADLGGPAAAAPPATGALAERAAPHGLTSVDDPGGGRLLSGILPPSPTTEDAFHAGLRSVRGYFDAPPHFVGAVRSKDGYVTIATFTAKLGGAAVDGILYTVFDPDAGARVGILFDRTDRSAHTLPILIARFKALAPPVPNGALEEHVARDRTAAAMLPASWSILALQDGTIIARSPNDAFFAIRVIYQLTDPRAPLAPGSIPATHTADAVAALTTVQHAVDAREHKPDRQLHVDSSEKIQLSPGTVTSARVTGTETYDGVRRRFDRQIYVTPLDASGRWQVQLNELSAPEASFAREMPLLTTIWQSYRYDPAAHARAILGEAKAYNDRNRAVFEHSMAAARAAQDSIDRSTAGFVDYLRGGAVIATPDGEHYRMNASVAEALAAADPNFRVLSSAEYVKGVDY